MFFLDVQKIETLTALSLFPIYKQCVYVDSKLDKTCLAHTSY